MGEPEPSNSTTALSIHMARRRAAAENQDVNVSQLVREAIRVVYFAGEPAEKGGPT
jgi:hypothetical protein